MMTRSQHNLEALGFPAAALALASLTSLAVAMAPASFLETIVAATGLPTLFAAAQPPLGAKARALLSFVGGAAAALAFLAAYLILEYRARAARSRPRFTPLSGTPQLRRGNAHPDHPPRRPIFAAEDLGVAMDEVCDDIVPRGGETIADLLARFESGLELRRAAE